MEPESLNLYGDVADWQYGPVDGNYHGGKEEGEE
jgi:hypothetical protein